MASFPSTPHVVILFCGLCKGGEYASGATVITEEKCLVVGLKKKKRVAKKRTQTPW